VNKSAELELAERRLLLDGRGDGSSYTGSSGGSVSSVEQDRAREPHGGYSSDQSGSSTASKGSYRSGSDPDLDSAGDEEADEGRRRQAQAASPGTRSATSASAVHRSPGATSDIAPADEAKNWSQHLDPKTQRLYVRLRRRLDVCVCVLRCSRCPLQLLPQQGDQRDDMVSPSLPTTRTPVGNRVGTEHGSA